MKIDIDVLGKLCAHCERLKLVEDYDDDLNFIKWKCDNLEDCRWVIDEYSKEMNARKGITELKF